MSAAIVANASGKNAGTNQYTVTLPAGIQAGDLLVVVALGPAPTDAGKGWWLLAAAAVGTRSYHILARLYNPADASTVYTIHLNAAAVVKWIGIAVRDHAVTTSADIQMGAAWRRQDNGGSQALVVAPGLTTTLDNELVLAMTVEASNSLGAYTVTTNPGFTKVTEVTEGATAGSNIEWITLWSMLKTPAGASGDFQINYGTAASLNGVGQQLAIPSAGATPPPATACIGGHAITLATPVTLTVGARRLRGTSVFAVLFDSAGTTELQRKSLPADVTTLWGSAKFTGLTADTVYRVKFEVDGVIQTDALIQRAKTQKPASGAVSFVAVGGSCQFTGSSHPIFRAMAEKSPEFISHMGDLHYGDPTTDVAWRAFVETSLAAANFQYLLDQVPFYWTWDNHDRIILDAGASNSPLNMGYTDPLTNSQWKTFSGTDGYLSADSAGRAWRIGRVLFIQTDQWTMKDDPDAIAEPRTFLGAAQKQAFKDALQVANDSQDIALVVWWCAWTTLNNANGRWNSFNAETSELEAFIDARPNLKKKMVLIGGDSHSLQADSGTRSGSSYRFKGIPSLNISGLNRGNTAATGDGSAGWDIANGPIFAAGIPEAGWGAYSLLTVTDNGAELRLRWEARRVHQDSPTTFTEDVIAFFERSYGGPKVALVGETPAKFASLGTKRIWTREDKGSDYIPGSVA